MFLPEDKLVALQAVILDFLHWHRASKRQLQSLAGRLNWACQVVYGGHTFLRRILDAIASLTSSSARYRLTSDFYADLLWWHHFLVVFNGKCLFLNYKPLVEVQTDACYEAAGAYFGGDWLYYNFTAESRALVDLQINYKETLAVVMAAERWGPAWSNKHVIVGCDNQAAVAIINKGSTSNSFVMHFLLKLFWISALYNFHNTARYVEGCKNVIADVFSRMHIGSYLFEAFNVLCSAFPCEVVHMQLLAICLMPVLYFSLLVATLASMPSQELKAETFYYHASTFAESTKATYKSHRDSYLRFFIFMGYNPIPASTFVISQYASFLARSFKFSSVKAYLGVISLLHKELSLPNPLSDNQAVKSLNWYQKGKGGLH